jgi:glutathionyl-hydroquinone reductase
MSQRAVRNTDGQKASTETERETGALVTSRSVHRGIVKTGLSMERGFPTESFAYPIYGGAGCPRHREAGRAILASPLLASPRLAYPLLASPLYGEGPL